MLDGKINDPYKTHRIRALTIVNKKSVVGQRIFLAWKSKLVYIIFLYKSLSREMGWGNSE